MIFCGRVGKEIVDRKNKQSPLALYCDSIYGSLDFSLAIRSNNRYLNSVVDIVATVI